MKKFIIPQISPDITIHQLNKRDFFIHQTIFDYRIKISSELSNFISLIDNKKSLEEIIEEYNKVYHVKLPYDFAFQFLFTKLASYGIILNGTAGVFPNQKPNYLKLSFIVFSEQRVSILSQKLHFLFAKKNIVIVIILSFIIGFYSLSNYNIYHTAISTSNWISFFILSFLSVTMHEFGHASAAHHYGAKHGGIGGGFYLLMPVYFADVTDIWKLSKAQRIVVNFAGIYFELIFVILIILTGLFLNMTEMLVFGYLILLSSLRNLNPFIRSDGYWILSDTIEKPNLMYHSLNKVREILRSSTKWVLIDFFLLFYGLISYGFFIYFVYYVLIENPDSILYFPRNLQIFIENLLLKNSKFSLADIGKLFIPTLFFYLLFIYLKSFVSKITIKFWKKIKSRFL